MCVRLICAVGPSVFSAPVELALLRRRPAATIRYGSLVIDEDALGAAADGTHLQLTGTEFELLRYLARFPNRVHAKTNILDHV